MVRHLSKCGADALRMTAKSNIMRFAAAKSRATVSACRISQPKFESRHATIGARVGTICTSMNANTRMLMNVNTRSFSNTVTGVLAEDTAAMSVVRKLLVDGQLPAKSVTYVPAASGRTFEVGFLPLNYVMIALSAELIQVMPLPGSEAASGRADRVSGGYSKILEETH